MRNNIFALNEYCKFLKKDKRSLETTDGLEMKWKAKGSGGKGIRRPASQLRSTQASSGRTSHQCLLLCAVALLVSSTTLTVFHSEDLQPRLDQRRQEPHRIYREPIAREDPNVADAILTGSLPCSNCRWDWQGQLLVLTAHVQSPRKISGLALLRSCVEVDRMEWNSSVISIGVREKWSSGSGEGWSGNTIGRSSSADRFLLVREREGWGCVKSKEEFYPKHVKAVKQKGVEPYCGYYLQVVRFELESLKLRDSIGRAAEVSVRLPKIGPLYDNSSKLLGKCRGAEERKAYRVYHGQPTESDAGRKKVVVFDGVLPKHVGPFVQPFGTRMCTRITGEVNPHELSAWIRYYVEVHKMDSIVIYDVRNPSSQSLEIELQQLAQSFPAFGKPSTAKPQRMSFGGCEIQIVDVRPLLTAMQLVLKRGMQTPLMDDCLMSANGTYRWAGFIDIDEFIEIEEDSPSNAELVLPGGAAGPVELNKKQRRSHTLLSRRLLNPRQSLHEFLEVRRHDKKCEAVTFGPVHFALEICELAISPKHTYKELFANAVYHLDEDPQSINEFAKAYPKRFVRHAFGTAEGVEGRRKLFVNPRKAWMARSVHGALPFGKRGTELSHKRCTERLSRTRIRHYRGYGNLLSLRTRCSVSPKDLPKNLSVSRLFGCDIYANNGETHHFCGSFLHRPYMRISSAQDFLLPT